MLETSIRLERGSQGLCCGMVLRVLGTLLEGDRSRTSGKYFMRTGFCIFVPFYFCCNLLDIDLQLGVSWILDAVYEHRNLIDKWENLRVFKAKSSC